LEKKLKSGLLLADFKGAYNRVDHSKLLEKLCKLGVDLWLVRWVKMWLSGRSAVFENYFIALGDSSLPQGSPLSCILFVIFNDIELGEIRVVMFCYADDTAFLVFGPTWVIVDELMRIILKFLSGWCRGNGMSLCIEKTEILYFFREKSPSGNLSVYS